jgi:hypothetical protein
LGFEEEPLPEPESDPERFDDVVSDFDDEPSPFFVSDLVSPPDSDPDPDSLPDSFFESGFDSDGRCFDPPRLSVE